MVDLNFDSEWLLNTPKYTQILAAIIILVLFSGNETQAIQN